MARRVPGLDGDAVIDDNDGMATLSIRNLPEEVHVGLRVRAARAGRSMEAEARAILAEACAPEPRVTGADLQDTIARLYGGAPPSGVVADLIAERREEAAHEP